MKRLTLDDVPYASLTFDEERRLAGLVMDCLSKKWVREEFNDHLKKIFHGKCKYGSLLEAEDLKALSEHCRFWDIEPFEAEDDGEDIYATMDCYPDKERKSRETREMTILTWREVWESHEEIKAIADEFAVFPVKHSPELTEGEKAEMSKEFWKEVEAVTDKFAREGEFPSEEEVKAFVADYMPYPED